MAREGTIMGWDDSRVNNLPDCILHHILSFLDTETSVRTSLLSRRWTDLWKGVNVLDLRASSFRCKSSLQKLLFSYHASVEKVSFQFGQPEDQVDQYQLFDMVMGYAAATASRRGLQVLSVNSDLSSVASSIARHHHPESLATLKLEDAVPNPLLDLGFDLLTTLELRRCTVALSTRTSANEGIYDPFANLPSLSNLKLLGCFSMFPFRVSGHQLLNLEIRCDPDSVGYGQLRIGELAAPKLQSLYISGHAFDIRDLEEVHLPSLAHASVHLEWPTLQVGFFARNNTFSQRIDRANCAFTKLLRGLHNTKSLYLCFDSFAHKSQQEFLLARMKPLIEHELSRFSRLKTLKIRYPYESPSICNYLKALSIC